MKKVLVLFLLMTYFLSMVISYKVTDNEQLENVQNVENEIAQRFVIPGNTAIANPEEVYPVLESVANKLQVNLFRPMFTYQDEGVDISKYLLLTSRTTFYDSFTLTNGEALSKKETQSGVHYLSTRNSEDPNQIGTIKDFGGNDEITIKPLAESYNSLPVDGYYYVEAADQVSYDEFYLLLSEELNKQFQSSFTPEEFKDASTPEAFSKSSLDYLNYITYIVFLFILLFLLYYIFSNAKQIGVMKLHGISNLRIWFTSIGKILVITFVISILISLVTSLLIEGMNKMFISNLLVQQAKTFGVFILLSLIGFFYIATIKVNQIIKNRKDTKGIFVFNYVLKIACTIGVLLMISSIIEQYATVSEKQHMLDNWEISKEYGLFYPFEVGFDTDEVTEGLPRTTLAMNKELYPILNEMGSVLINARSYEEQALTLDSNFTGIRSITINPNYLNEFRVNDTANKPVTIEESETNWILLVPNQYRDKENEIVKYFTDQRKQDREYGKKYLGETAPPVIQNQAVQIVWLASNQEIFSFNPEVFKNEKNVIVDPIIQVITEGNSLASDRDSILGNGGTDPLKIKLLQGDPAATYETLAPELSRLNLDDNLKHLVNVNQLVLEEIYDLKQEIKMLMSIGLLLFFGLLFLIIQSLLVHFNQNEQKYTIYRLFGIGFIRTYQSYLLILLLTWVLQYSVMLVIKKDVQFDFVVVMTILMFIEFCASIVTVLILESRNKVRVLKGG
ncbi:DUF1430 domain-containing protein [Bacillus sp. NTK071]|uniref:DUF1430 domain-containing protein n=1 Tax=Bacillus sp. NTK071 TaxID=2802175 RepID=UPI001A8DEAC7|nr:DUF1430 domain-containing protein [Bacillus sp. NTK071]